MTLLITKHIYIYIFMHSPILIIEERAFSLSLCHKKTNNCHFCLLTVPFLVLVELTYTAHSAASGAHMASVSLLKKTLFGDMAAVLRKRKQNVFVCLSSFTRLFQGMLNLNEFEHITQSKLRNIQLQKYLPPAI